MPQADPTLQRPRRHLHFEAWVGLVRQRFEGLPEPRRDPDFSLADTVMAGLALFSLKDPSLLALMQRAVDHNLRRVFGLRAVPSETQMRTIRDDVDPGRLRPAFQDVFRQWQRGKVLEPEVFLEGCYLVARDGVEDFRSQKVHGDQCLRCQHKSGGVSDYHQMLAAVLVHPDFPEVLPRAPEPIPRCDGQEKNDCERNAARRWLRQFRTDHPPRPIIVTEDALSSKAPHIRDLRDNHVPFLLGVKEGDHQHLFAPDQRRRESGPVEAVHEEEAPSGARRTWKFVNGVGLNASNPEVTVTLRVSVEVDARGEIHTWAWVTDLPVAADTVRRVARGGRTRWRIENETFHTLKDQGSHFEPNSGHGSQHLAVVFAGLMMRAFLIDQVQQLQKGKPLEKTKETDAIFANVKQVKKQGRDDPEALEISVDTKAKVALGDDARGGKNPDGERR